MTPLILSRPRIQLITPEITELPGPGDLLNIIQFRTGGLADYSSALIHAFIDLSEKLKEQSKQTGFDFSVILPEYEKLIDDRAKLAQITQRERILIRRYLHDNNVFFVRSPAFEHLGVYETDERHPSWKRAVEFTKGAREYMRQWQPDIVMWNDWMCGLMPAVARELGIDSIGTWHNTHTHEASLQQIVNEAGLQLSPQAIQSLYRSDWPEMSERDWHGNKADFLSSGLLASRFINTVSPTYLEEMLRGEGIPPPKNEAQARQFMRLQEVVRMRYAQGRAFGILNGINGNTDPGTEPDIINYEPANALEGKAFNKTDFRKRVGLENNEAALYVFTNRLDDQKGMNILLEAIPELMKKNIQIAFVANPPKDDPKYQHKIQQLAKQYKGRISYRQFDEATERQALAAADFFLMPSLYEPCGLAQMKALKHGAIPIVRPVGGLKDTVDVFTNDFTKGNGLHVDTYSAASLVSAVDESLLFYALPQEVRGQVIGNIMTEATERFSTKRQADAYFTKMIEPTLIERSSA